MVQHISIGKLSLFKGNYTPIRILQTLLNIFLLASVIGLMVSGIILSREVSDFLFCRIPGHDGAVGGSRLLCGEMDQKIKATNKAVMISRKCYVMNRFVCV